MKYAHVTDDNKQTVKEHLEGVAELSEMYSVELFKPLAYTVGIAHDIGKYAEDFQKRLAGSNIRFEHSACGAIEVGKYPENKMQEEMTYMLQYCIAGHHTGLPDGGTDIDLAEGDNTLHSRLKRSKYYTGSADYSSYNDEIQITLPDYTPLIKELNESQGRDDFVEKYAFFTRYIFSCLTDADYIDTERFFSPDIDRKLRSDFVSVEKSLDDRFSSFIADTPLKKARSVIQEQAIANSTVDSQISILNMPTGSGKTLCSLKIALKKLKEHNKKRIIYVIPYTSIIEQTAEIFEKMFGEFVDIVQHHSNYCYDNDYDSSAEKMKRSTENWDAPIIITTNVQFFQSLYHYKSSGLRKLHNLADAVIIFDEIHMLPIECLQPCLRAIGYVTKYLNSEAILMSATMPDHLSLIEKYVGACTYSDLIKDKSVFHYFHKCRYNYLGKTNIEGIIEKASRYKSTLIIVNSRKAAREIYNVLSGSKYHLSTYMTPKDRSDTIAMIRSDLSKGEKITVVSTSLVEAGVDLDFEAVFRQISGLDSILQSGGRCNREGYRSFGDVYIFETDEKTKGELGVRASIVKEMLEKGYDITSDDCIKEYYRRIYEYSDDLIDSNTIAHNITSMGSIPFRNYAESFKFIKDETVSVVIDNCDESSCLLSQLSFNRRAVKRRLQRYSVSLKIHGELDKALKSGLLRDTGDGVLVLADNGYYSSTTGLDINYQPDYIF